MTGINKKIALVIGDSHDSPKISKERFYWIGRHAAFLKPDILIHIGDLSSLDSLCDFIPDDTYTAKVTMKKICLAYRRHCLSWTKGWATTMLRRFY